jgi:hypothetical protein
MQPQRKIYWGILGEYPDVPITNGIYQSSADAEIHGITGSQNDDTFLFHFLLDEINNPNDIFADDFFPGRGIFKKIQEAFATHQDIGLMDYFQVFGRQILQGHPYSNDGHGFHCDQVL